MEIHDDILAGHLYFVYPSYFSSSRISFSFAGLIIAKELWTGGLD
jgi:hypothetical protein